MIQKTYSQLVILCFIFMFIQNSKCMVKRYAVNPETRSLELVIPKLNLSPPQNNGVFGSTSTSLNLNLAKPFTCTFCKKVLLNPTEWHQHKCKKGLKRNSKKRRTNPTSLNTPSNKPAIKKQRQNLEPPCPLCGIKVTIRYRGGHLRKEHNHLTKKIENRVWQFNCPKCSYQTRRPTKFFFHNCLQYASSSTQQKANNHTNPTKILRTISAPNDFTQVTNAHAFCFTDPNCTCPDCKYAAQFFKICTCSIKKRKPPLHYTAQENNKETYGYCEYWTDSMNPEQAVRPTLFSQNHLLSKLKQAQSQADKNVILKFINNNKLR
jgi:hypothetical protein